MNKMKDLFDEVCRKYALDHAGFSEEEIPDFLMSEGRFTTPQLLKYLNRSEKSYKKFITIEYRDEQEALDAARDLHEQLKDNKDYINGYIIVRISAPPNILKILVCNCIKTIPKILL